MPLRTVSLFFGQQTGQGAAGVDAADQRGETGNIMSCVLSEPAGDDGYLTAGDILHYQLLPFVQIVVVQAEETADVGFRQSFKGVLKSGTGAFDQVDIQHGAVSRIEIIEVLDDIAHVIVDDAGSKMSDHVGGVIDEFRFGLVAQVVNVQIVVVKCAAVDAGCFGQQLDADFLYWFFLV